MTEKIKDELRAAQLDVEVVLRETVREVPIKDYDEWALQFFLQLAGAVAARMQTREQFLKTAEAAYQGPLEEAQPKAS